MVLPKTNYILFCFFLIFGANQIYGQIFPNGDFELGPGGICNCATDYTCENDATRVIDGVHPVYVAGELGCVSGTTAHASSLGAHGGTGYMFFYAGGDRIHGPEYYFETTTIVNLCVWYAGPNPFGTDEQDTPAAHFSFSMDGDQIGPDIPVPTGTEWTEFCYSITVDEGEHSFGLRSGLSAQYVIWFDDISAVLCPYPRIDLGNDTTLCEGETFVLNVYQEGRTYSWQNGSTNASYEVTEAGKYWVTVSDSCGTVADTINVSYKPQPPIDLGNDTTLCLLDSLVLFIDSFYDDFSWYDDITDSSITIYEGGTYWLEASLDGCVKRDSIQVDYAPEISVNLGSDTVFCQGDTVLLDVSDFFAFFVWQDSSMFPTYYVTEEGTYWVEKIKGNCRGSDTLTAKVKPCDVIIEMPNIFTPDNDGVNDLFVPRQIIFAEDVTITVVDRWGVTMFESNDIYMGWNGYYNDIPCSDGVYFWIVSYKNKNDIYEHVTGSVTIAH